MVCEDVALGFCFDPLIIGLHHDDGIAQDAWVFLHRVAHDLDDLSALFRGKCDRINGTGFGGAGCQSQYCDKPQRPELNHGDGGGLLRTLIVKGGIRFLDLMKLEIDVIPETVAEEIIPVVQVDLVNLFVTMMYGF